MLKSYQFEVISSLFTDIAVFWLVTSLGTRDFLVLTGNLLWFILCLAVAMRFKSMARK